MALQVSNLEAYRHPQRAVAGRGGSSALYLEVGVGGVMCCVAISWNTLSILPIWDFVAIPYVVMILRLMYRQKSSFK